VVAMTAAMLNGGPGTTAPDVCGAMTSGEEPLQQDYHTHVCGCCLQKPQGHHTACSSLYFVFQSRCVRESWRAGAASEQAIQPGPVFVRCTSASLLAEKGALIRYGVLCIVGYRRHREHLAGCEGIPRLHGSPQRHYRARDGGGPLSTCGLLESSRVFQHQAGDRPSGQGSQVGHVQLSGQGPECCWQHPLATTWRRCAWCSTVHCQLCSCWFICSCPMCCCLCNTPNLHATKPLYMAT